jgi:hypothetical protein
LLTAQLATARGHVYTSGIALADQAREKHDSEGLRGYLNALRPQEGETDLRGFEWYYLWQKNSLQRLSLPTVTFPHDQFDLSHPEFVDRPSDRRRLVFSPDGKFIATTKHVCDAATGRTLVEFDEAADKVFFSFDNKYVSAGDIIVDLTTRNKASLTAAPMASGRSRRRLLRRGGPFGFPRGGECAGCITYRRKEAPSGPRGRANRNGGVAQVVRPGHGQRNRARVPGSAGVSHHHHGVL